MTLLEREEDVVFNHPSVRKLSNDIYDRFAKSGGDTDKADKSASALVESKIGIISSRVHKDHGFDKDDVKKFVRNFADELREDYATDIEQERFDIFTEDEIYGDETDDGEFGSCQRCGRELTDPESCARGVGPECAKK